MAVKTKPPKKKINKKEVIDLLVSSARHITHAVAEEIVSKLKPAKSVRVLEDPDILKKNAHKMAVSPLMIDIIYGEIVYRKEREKFTNLRNFLLDFYVSEKSINLIYKHLFELKIDDMIDYIQANPYNLVSAGEIPFTEIDSIALGLGYHHRSHERITGGIMHVIHSAMNQGHCYVWEDDLSKRVSALLKENISPTAVQDYCNYLSMQQKQVVVFSGYKKAKNKNNYIRMNRYYYLPLFFAERDCGQILSQNQKLKTPKKILIPEHLSSQQKEAAQNFWKNRLSVITGPPGVGKTYVIKTIADNCARLYPESRIRLCAPTGKAARKLTEVTGRKAETIHRMLMIRTKGQKYKSRFGRSNPLPADVVIVDEASMMDTFLLQKLLMACPQSRILFVGDPYQLPPVGPGCPLDDLVEFLPTTRLTRVFRQHEASTILSNAHNILNGQELKFDEQFQLVPCEKEEQARKEVISRARTENQVLCPRKGTLVGADTLNPVLREELNTKGPIGSFNVGDKVMCLANNYEKGTVNGEIGIVREILYADQGETIGAVIDFQGRRAFFEHFLFEIEITLAYAITVHKSQGSEYPEVIVPLVPSNKSMLKKPLFYTAITRAKERVVLIGFPDLLEIFYDDSESSMYRRTSLKHWIKYFAHLSKKKETKDSRSTDSEIESIIQDNNQE